MRVFLAMLLCCWSAFAATHTPDSLNYVDVSNKVAAASNGDTILLPAGNVNWHRGITTVNKTLSFLGQGTNATIINLTNASGNIGFQIDMIADGITFSNFTVNGATYGRSIYLKNYHRTVTNIHITRMLFLRNDDRAIEIEGWSYGCLDHCMFYECGGEDITCVNGDRDPADPDYDGSTAWTRPVVFGTRDALFVEDNVWIYNDGQTDDTAHCITSSRGARYVFRHNTITSTIPSAQGGMPAPIDAHGNWENGRGTVTWEVYKNTISSVSGWRTMHFRGGSGVVCSNVSTFTGALNRFIELNDYRVFETPLTYPDDYPSIDQVSNTWAWANTQNGVKTDPVVGVDNPIVQQFIVEGRDFSNAVLSGWAPFTYPHPLAYVGTNEPTPPSPVSRWVGTMRVGTVRQLPRLFQPPATAVAWWDAASGVLNSSGAVAANGNRVAQWGDRIAGRVAAQATDGARPYWTNYDGRVPALRFSRDNNTTAEWLAAAVPTAWVQTNHIFVAYHRTLGGANMFLVDGTNSAARNAVYVNGDEGYSVYAGDTAYGDANAARPDTNRWSVLRVVLNGANCEAQTNGAAFNLLSNVSNAGNDDMDGVTIGARYDGASHWRGFIGEVMILNGPTEPSEVERTWLYFSNKYRGLW